MAMIALEGDSRILHNSRILNTGKEDIYCIT